MMYTAYGHPKETNRSTGNYKQSVPTGRFKQTSSSSRLEAHSLEPAFSENTSKEGAHEFEPDFSSFILPFDPH